MRLKLIFIFTLFSFLIKAQIVGIIPSLPKENFNIIEDSITESFINNHYYITDKADSNGINDINRLLSPGVMLADMVNTDGESVGASVHLIQAQNFSHSSLSRIASTNPRIPDVLWDRGIPIQYEDTLIFEIRGLEDNQIYTFRPAFRSEGISVGDSVTVIVNDTLIAIGQIEDNTGWLDSIVTRTIDSIIEVKVYRRGRWGDINLQAWILDKTPSYVLSNSDKHINHPYWYGLQDITSIDNSQDSVVKITITFQNTPTLLSIDYADLKYDKDIFIGEDYDDANSGVLNFLKRANESDLFFTDGTGVKIPYSVGMALNVAKITDSTTIGFGYNFNGVASVNNAYDLSRFYIDNRITYSNHSYAHKDAPTYSRADSSLTATNKFWHDSIGFVMNTMINPTNYGRYTPVADTLGFIGSSSENATWTDYSLQNSLLLEYDSLSLDFLPLKRAFTVFLDDDGDPGFNFNKIITGVQAALDSSDNGKHYGYRWGTHDWIDTITGKIYDTILEIVDDRAWVASLQEHLDYRIVKNEVDTSWDIQGNSLILTLNYSNVNSSVSFHDLSFIVSEPLTLLNSVSSSSGEVTFNNSTGLVNFSRRRTIWDNPSPHRDSNAIEKYQPIPMFTEGILQEDDIIYEYSSVLETEEYEGEPSDHIAMFDTTDIVFSGLLPIGSKELDPVYTWNIPIEAVKQGERKPEFASYALKHPIKVYNIYNWRGKAFSNTDNAWHQVFGAVKEGEWVALTDSLGWNFSRAFKTTESRDTTTWWNYIKIDRGHYDINGYTESGNTGTTKTILHIKRNNNIDLEYRLPEAPKSTKTFSQSLGVNAYYYEEDSLVGLFKNVSQFENETWHWTGDSLPWMVLPTWDYRSSYPNDIGSDGLRMVAVRGGMDTCFKLWNWRGTENIVIRHQENHNSNLRDSLNKTFNGTQRLSKEIMVMPKYTSLPEYFLTYPPVYVDTIVWEDRDTSAYDYGPELLEAWFDTIYYPISGSDTSYSSWCRQNNWVKKDTVTGIPYKWKAIEDAFRMHPKALAAIADPSNRDSVYGAYQTYAEFGKFMFDYSAVYGRNTSWSTDSLNVINKSTIPIGLDLVQTTSSQNEYPKTWKGGLGLAKPQMLGMEISVNYDGHMGLAHYKGSHCLGVRTADTTMQYLLPSDLEDDYSTTIEALKWAYYYRGRDYDIAPNTHPCSGLPKDSGFVNLIFDTHIYLNSNNSGQNQSTSNGNIVTPEFHNSFFEVPEAIRTLKALEPDCQVYVTETGISSLNSYLSANRFYFRDSVTGIIDSNYDLSYAQGSSLLWQQCHHNTYLDASFIYELIEKSTYAENIDTTTIPYSYDRQAGSDASTVSGFAGTALYTRVIGVGDANKHHTPKPAAYTLQLAQEVFGDSHQLSYTQYESDTVGRFVYYDSTTSRYTEVWRRYSMQNETTSDFDINLPYGAENIIRIEPVRNQPEFELISISDTDYTTNITEKVFLITYSMSDDITSFRADFSSNDTMYVKDVNFVGDEDTVYILAPNVKVGDNVSVDTTGQGLNSTLTVTAYDGYVKIYRTLTGSKFAIKKRMPLYIIKP